MASKLTRGLLLVAALLILAGLSCAVANPARRSRRAIRRDLLVATPIGTQYREALRALQKRFKDVHVNAESGFLRQEPGREDVVGVRSIEVHLGRCYRFPFGITSVDAFWGFDSEGRLLDVWVWKTTDAP
jgi:hypothetical protein